MTFQDHLQLAPIGSILVSYGDGPHPAGIKGKLLQIAYNGIRKHQQARYPNSSKTDGVHVQIKVGYFEWVSAEFPEVTLETQPAAEGRKYRLYRYSFDLDSYAHDRLREYALAMVGKQYDTLQLVGIATNEQKWIPKFMRTWLSHRLQLPGRKEVCSTLCHRALLAAARGTAGHRPLGNIDPFDACPADFEHHPTFQLLAEINT